MHSAHIPHTTSKSEPYSILHERHNAQHSDMVDYIAKYKIHDAGGSHELASLPNNEEVNMQRFIISLKNMLSIIASMNTRLS